MYPHLIALIFVTHHIYNIIGIKILEQILSRQKHIFWSDLTKIPQKNVCYTPLLYSIYQKYPQKVDFYSDRIGPFITTHIIIIRVCNMKLLIEVYHRKKIINWREEILIYKSLSHVKCSSLSCITAPALCQNSWLLYRIYDLGK